jgi:hypothetical protein
MNPGGVLIRTGSNFLSRAIEILEWAIFFLAGQRRCSAGRAKSSMGIDTASMGGARVPMVAVKLR